MKAIILDTLLVSLLDQCQVKKVEKKGKDTLAEEVEVTTPAGEVSEDAIDVYVIIVINSKVVT